jgi:hydrophobic/amphiphilic exporter-1 (mainly G- bacteria), HAE1 family
MSIYKNAVRKPITTLMIFAAVMVFGLYSLSNLPIDLYPDIELPMITVMTSYPGASSADIETNISRPIENSLNTVSNLKEITSVSRDNLSIVTLEFEYETDLDGAANDIRDALSLVESFLPEEVDDPMIFKFSTSMMPILMYAITAGESYEGIQRLLQNEVINPLNRIEGIGSISLMGAPVREISIEIDPRKLEAYNLTVEQIGGLLTAENLNMPTGNIKMGQMGYPLRIEGQFSNSDLITDIVLGNFNGQTILLKDVATVRDSIKEMTNDEKINGQPGVRMMVMKQSGANTVKVAREVTKELNALLDDLPEDVVIHTIFNSSDFIRGSIRNLTTALLYALIFVTLVVLFFLGRWRATFIIVLTIPIALIVSFIYLNITGNSINIISLSALSIAIGMVVDDAIVVLENISRHIDRGSSPREAAIYATNEVWLAVIITTLTVVAVFFPMTMVSGMTGVMFRQLGWIVSITVVTSTVAAITLTPMLSSKMLKLRTGKNKTGIGWHERKIQPMFTRLDNWYGKALNWSLNNKWKVTVAAIVILLGSIVLATVIESDFMPETDEGSLSVTVELQSGTRVEKTIEVARKIDSFLEGIPEVDLISTSAGSDDEGGFISMFFATGSNIINFNLSLIDLDERERSVWDVSEIIRIELDKYPEIVKHTTETGSTGFGGTTIDVEIYGYDLDQTTQYANEVAKRLESIDGARNIDISREKEKPELRIELDRDKMAAAGLNTYTVSNALYNRVTGLIATRFREEGEEYNVKIRLKEEYRNSITDIENITLQSPSGQSIRLGEIGEVVEYWSPPNLQRKGRERMVTVSVTPHEVSIGRLAVGIKDVVSELEAPEGISVQLGGVFEDQQEGFADIGKLLALSLLLVYIVMASQFESLRMPFIIMFSIPFAFSGVILALLITNTTLSVIAGLGAVMLIGIVVKNAIVLVDFINLMRERGHTVNEAIILSGKSRLRPVLMTAITTILAMLPLALSTGEGSEIWSPMGIAVIGGLIFSTVITMIIVPVVYGRFADRDEKRKLSRQSKN